MLLPGRGSSCMDALSCTCQRTGMAMGLETSKLPSTRCRAHSVFRPKPDLHSMGDVAVAQPCRGVH